jgi:hypothetical protein
MQGLAQEKGHPQDTKLSAMLEKLGGRVYVAFDN